MRPVLLLAVALIVAAGLWVYLKTRTHGFSARQEPTAIEAFLARAARRMAVPASAKTQPNPVPETPEALAEGRAHWADHCASCHANNGSGDTEIGRGLYPRSPDMRQAETQNLTDGELFFIIENGIRMSGMPAWGGSGGHEDASWKLVRFIRHLPRITPDEEREMQKMNPRTPAELREEMEEEEFLKGNDAHALH